MSSPTVAQRAFVVTEQQPTVIHANYNANGSDIKGRQVIYLKNDQNALKGILWGIVAFKMAGMGLSGLGFTAVLSPLIVTPAALLPVVSGILTYVLLDGASSCFKNACHHLGSAEQQVVVVRG